MLRDRVASMIRRLERGDVNMHGFLLSVGGRLKAGAYYSPFREGQPHRMYSVSKTMTGLAVGMLADEGKLDLDRPVAEYFPDLLPENPDGRVLRQTIRDMLRMATCYSQTAYREREDSDWTRPFFCGQPTHEPGTVFHYDTGASQVLAALCRRAGGAEVIDFLERRLFTPLGLEDERFWLRDPSGCCQGGTGLCMSLRDLNKVSLCLADGGRGLVPAWYVREMTRRQIGTWQRQADEEKYGYGWQCWQTRNGWSMYGLGGQMVIACPEKEALLTTVADTRLDPCGVQKTGERTWSRRPSPSGCGPCRTARERRTPPPGPSPSRRGTPWESGPFPWRKTGWSWNGRTAGRRFRSCPGITSKPGGRESRKCPRSSPRATPVRGSCACAATPSVRPPAGLRCCCA